MSWKSALRVPLDTDLMSFISLLRQQGIVHRVTEESGEQVLWVFGEAQSEQVQGLYQEYLSGQWPEEAILQASTPRSTPFQTPGFIEQLQRSPITAAGIVSCLLVALITQLGDNIERIRWLTFHDFRIQGDYLYFVPLADSLAQGEWWRLWSPMLLHFGLLHLAMN